MRPLLCSQTHRLSMRILFDHGTPAPLISYLPSHSVTKARARRWDKFSNGELLKAAEDAGFDLLLTTDKRIRYQQNLTGRRIAIVVLGNAQWPLLRRYVDRVVLAVNDATSGSYAMIDVPFK
jgi:hypothetical protein